MSNDVKLEDRLNCFGYFGFGGGYAMAKWGTATDTKDETYCSRCAQAQRCWDRHRVRVKNTWPDLAALSEQVGRDNPHNFTTAWLEATGQSTEHFTEPFTSMMMGNMEDGVRVANNEQPKYRGESSLTWPLTPLR